MLRFIGLGPQWTDLERKWSAKRGERMEKKYCGYCVYATYVKDKGYYCEHRLLGEKRLIKVCPRYHLGTCSPRWCPRKEKK